jgi:hypothetical protein
MCCSLPVAKSGGGGALGVLGIWLCSTLRITKATGATRFPISCRATAGTLGDHQMEINSKALSILSYREPDLKGCYWILFMKHLLAINK